MIRDGAADLLSGLGYAVRTAEDGEAGLHLLKAMAGKLDIALIDIQVCLIRHRLDGLIRRRAG